MDAIRLLKEDHKKVKGLFSEYEGLGDRAEKSRQKIARSVFDELKSHTMIEEEIFYPGVKKVADDEVQKHLLESYEEHHVIKTLIAEMESLSYDDVFDAKFNVMRENVEHHIAEEEDEWFPDVRTQLGEVRLRELGEKMSARKDELTTNATISR